MERKPRNRPVNNFYVPPPARKSEIPTTCVANESKTKERTKLKSPTEETKVCNNSSLLFCKNDPPLQSSNRDPLSSKNKSKRKRKSLINKNPGLENTDSTLKHESKPAVLKSNRTVNYKKTASSDSLSYRSPPEQSIIRNTINFGTEKVNSMLMVDAYSSLPSNIKKTDDKMKMCNNSSLLFQSDEDSDHYEREKVNFNSNLDMKNGLACSKPKTTVNEMKRCENSSLLFQSDDDSDYFDDYGSEKINSKTVVENVSLLSKSKNAVQKIKLFNEQSLFFQIDESKDEEAKTNYSYCGLENMTRKNKSNRNEDIYRGDYKNNKNHDNCIVDENISDKICIIDSNVSENCDIIVSNENISASIDVCSTQIIDNLNACINEDTSIDSHDSHSLSCSCLKCNDKQIRKSSKRSVDKEESTNASCYGPENSNDRGKSYLNHENISNRSNVWERDQISSDDNHGNQSSCYNNSTINHKAMSKPSNIVTEKDKKMHISCYEPDNMLNNDKCHDNGGTSESDGNANGYHDVSIAGKHINSIHETSINDQKIVNNHNICISDESSCDYPNSCKSVRSSDNHIILGVPVETDNVIKDGENENKCIHNSDLDPHINSEAQSLHDCTLKVNLDNPSDNLVLYERKDISDQSIDSNHEIEEKKVLDIELNSITPSPTRKSRKNSSSYSSSDEEYGSAHEEILFSTEEDPSRAETPCVLSHSDFENNSSIMVSEKNDEVKKSTIKTQISNYNEISPLVASNNVCETGKKIQPPGIGTENQENNTILKGDPNLKNIDKKKKLAETHKCSTNKLNSDSIDSSDSPSLEDEDFDWEKLTDADFNNLIVAKHSEIENANSVVPDFTEHDSNDCSIIEIYGFPVEFKTQDILMSFNAFISRGFKLKWVDDTHALGIFPSLTIADEALRTQMPFLKTRPLSQATALSQEKAKYLRLSSASRPKTCSALARRLVSGALGVRAVFTREERQAELEILKEAREKKKLAAKQRDAAWEGKF